MASSPATIVIFGASGDLTRRKLGPSLYELHRKGRLDDGVRIVGFSRTEMSDDAFRDYLEESTREAVPEFESGVWDEFAPRLHYVTGDLTEDAAFERLGQRLEALEVEPARRIYYLAVAPRFFEPAVRGLGAAGLANGPGHAVASGAGQAGAPDPCRNLVVEKPFGKDRESARLLNETLREWFAEEQIYRIDHYLGKETAQNLLYLRFANTIFEPIWNRNYVDNVQITVAESVDVGRRAGYYDRSGVLRDMFQNHLMQLFTLVALEPPTPLNARTLRDEKVKVLAATREIWNEEDVIGQYEGYREAEGVADGSRTPTFAALRLSVENWRWEGVPFYLRSGKALATKATTINIVFKRPPTQLFGAFQNPAPNVLSLCIQPDEGVHLQFDAKVPDMPSKTSPVDMEFHYDTSFPTVDLPDAYERLLLDVLNSDPSLFARSDEIDAAWALLDPVIRRAESPEFPDPLPYPRGSWGPAAADELLARDGRQWRPVCASHD